MKLKGRINLENADLQFSVYNYEGLLNLTTTRVEGGDNNEVQFTTDNPNVVFTQNGTTCFIANEPNAKISVAAVNASSFIISFQTLACQPITSCNWTNFEIDFELN